MIAGPGPATGNLTAAAQAVSIVCSQFARVSIQLTGTWAGTVTFEGSADGGGNWFGISPIPTTSTARTTGVASATANGLWDADTSSLTNVRARCTAYTSGTIAVRLETAELDK